MVLLRSMDCKARYCSPCFSRLCISVSYWSKCRSSSATRSSNSFFDTVLVVRKAPVWSLDEEGRDGGDGHDREPDRESGVVGGAPVYQVMGLDLPPSGQPDGRLMR